MPPMATARPPAMGNEESPIEYQELFQRDHPIFQQRAEYRSLRCDSFLLPGGKVSKNRRQQLRAGPAKRQSVWDAHLPFKKQK